MTPPLLPADAATLLRQRLARCELSWLAGVHFEFDGDGAKLIVLATDEARGGCLVEMMGGRWRGYAVEARKAGER